ncbi:patatin-like phospholipase family protein [Ramlibacter algicola]|uniref:Patatin-like phospholipase family protein n=1 Tax=Ramlibacter algicola TaxID=2795217 RepID=A0A934UQW2_9BURK|nr:patatin-like phospholipase family protein [Ramlibacter algicola]MBK0391927.1 patatin-like phospholipase family protein [Ramlibacter algicola]
MSKTSTPRIALALAGGGPLGAIFEIGALCALEEALDGIALEKLDHYVGISAGGFLAAALANGMPPRELCASFIENRGDSEVFDPAWLMVPAFGEFLRRSLKIPAVATAAVWRTFVRRKPITHVLEQLGPLLPTGLFSSEEIDRRLARVFTQPGRTNDFRELRTRLTLVATDLDTGDAAPFGESGWDDVPISRAVQASAALPGLFPPVRIGDKHFVDGALSKTMHASVALARGVDLMLCINPLVSFDATGAGGAIPRLVDGGLPAVLGQALRTMIRSRLELGMKQYQRAYPDTDMVLIEPDPRDARWYMANTFSYRQRRELAEHAYQHTRSVLLSQHGALATRFARHGLTLREDVLRERRVLVTPTRAPRRLQQSISTLRATLDDLGRQVRSEAA